MDQTIDALRKELKEENPNFKALMILLVESLAVINTRVNALEKQVMTLNEVIERNSVPRDKGPGALGGMSIG